MKFFLISIFLIITYPAIFAQWSLNETKSDSIFIGIENKLMLDYGDCSNIIVKCAENLNITKEGCNFFLNPTKILSYQIIVLKNQKPVDTILLHSTRSRVKNLLYISNGFMLNKEIISIRMAKKIGGLKAITNVPWEREVCIIFSYDFTIIRNQKILHYSKNRGSLLSVINLKLLNNVRKGDLVKFTNIKRRCPGNGHHRFLEEIFEIE